MDSKLQTIYKKEIVPALKKEFGFNNLMQVPKIEKVIINVGYGRHNKNKSYIENVENTLSRITGQRPVHNLAKQSISNFKIREGMDIGMSVTLRGKSMYDFLYRFIHIALPRVRDFRGLNPKSFDKQGNYSIGIKENIAFPEVTAETLEKIHGLQVVIATTANNKKEGMSLLRKMGLPIKK
ncbi:MAG: 50S ribosomal protein L5 [Candidatus Magasanikbacteria bacterium]|nr:50S ribosomal protein L5 [Candidatus Magasanikbacteria bacterium]